MPSKFDLVVIGTGSGGSVPANKCREAGWEVAVIDELPYGGTCALRGCDPKKVLVGAAELLDWQGRMRGNGVTCDDARIDWPALMRFKSTFTGPVPQKREEAFSKRGIAMFHGAARFTGRQTIEVGGKTLTSRFFVIATGARPATLGVPGEKLLTSSTEFLELQQLPKRIVFVGGGYISFEFAHVAARAGAKATILHRGKHPLKGFDPDLVARLVEATRDIGIDVRLESPLRAVEIRGGTFVARAGGEQNSFELEADLVVHGAGRVPNIDGLDLEAAGVESNKDGVVVNDHLRSLTNPAVYAAGDVAATPGAPLTPVASMEGHVVASNLLKGDQRSPDYSGISSVVFTVPPLASVGLLEAEARDKGLKVRVETGETSKWYSSRRTAEPFSGYKTIVDEDSGMILGAHLFGAHSEDLINIFALAIRHRIRAVELKRMIYAYPSRTSDVPFMV